MTRDRVANRPPDRDRGSLERRLTRIYARDVASKLIRGSRLTKDPHRPDREPGISHPTTEFIVSTIIRKTSLVASVLASLAACAVPVSEEEETLYTTTVVTFHE